MSGPACGLHYSVKSSASKLSVTLGRVTPSDMVLKDSEVSGKHAMINWNVNVRFMVGFWGFIFPNNLFF